MSNIDFCMGGGWLIAPAVLKISLVIHEGLVIHDGLVIHSLVHGLSLGYRLSEE